MIEKEVIQEWKRFLESDEFRHSTECGTLLLAQHFADWQKEQMMAKAIDGEVGYWNLRGLSVNVKLPRSVGEGDKVKVLVVKED